MLKAYAVAVVSMLAGAAVVHNVYKPDLVRTLAMGEVDYSISSLAAHPRGYHIK